MHLYASQTLALRAPSGEVSATEYLYALQALALRASVLVLQVRLTFIVSGKLYMYLAHHLDHVRLLHCPSAE